MDNLKSLRIELDFVTDSGERTKKEQTIKVNNPSLKEKSKSYFYHIKSIYTLSFIIQIPEFIHSYVIGKSVPSIRSEQSKDYKKDFPKSINRPTIEALTEQWCELISDYIWLKKIENTPLKKVIFYEFKNRSIEYKSYWNGVDFGRLAELEYKHSIGFISEIDGNQVRYNNQKISISSSQDKEFYKIKFVEWSIERELFFINIQKSFETIIDKINKFESSITEETINELIYNSPLLLNN
mgnify:CR=1 FL=1